MGSRHQITFVLACIILHQMLGIVSAVAKEKLHEERREYQYQHSSQIIGSSFVPGFYNSHSGQYEQLNADLDNWVQHNREQVQGMAEKLRSQYNAALSSVGSNGYYEASSSNYANSISSGSTNCNLCAFISTATGKTQEELDAITRNMTMQILEDMQSGKLARNQINQPNWFENRVAQKLEELNKQHQLQYQNNVYSRGSYIPPIHYVDSRTSYGKDLQQSQQNIFNTNTGFYQGQSQSQHSFQTQPVSRYYTESTVQQTRHPYGYYEASLQNSNRYNKEHHQTMYPTPIMVTNTVQTEKNYTISSDNSNRNQSPPTNVYRINQEEYLKNRSQSEQNRSHHAFEYVASSTPLPEVTLPTVYSSRYPYQSQTLSRNTTETEQTQKTIPIIVPSRPSFVRKQEDVRQTRLEIRNNTSILQQTPSITYDTQRATQHQANTIDVHTPPPVIETNSRHSIYGYLDESEILPNYRPRVIINKTTKFQDFDYRHENEYTSPQIHTQERYTPNVMTTDLKPMSQIFIQNNDTRKQQSISNQGYYIPSTNYNQTIQYSWSGILNHNRVKPLYNQHTYTITCTDQEYQTRLRKIQDELSRLGYENLSDREYNASIASGGFIHNGYKYVFNTNRNRYEKGDRTEITNTQYQSLYDLIRNKLEQDRDSPMTEQEINQTISTGVYIRGGYKWTYNSETDRFDRDQISTEERHQIFNRIKEILIRLGYRQITQKEYNDFLMNGAITRAGYRWTYNYMNGTLGRSEHVGDLAEFSQIEYEDLYRIIQQTIQKLGYAQMTGKECNSTITTGAFERGGIRWMYNPQMHQFERVELNQEEYQSRLNILRSELDRLGYRQLTPEEYREIIYIGYFFNGGYRYEYNSNYGRYVRVELTEVEYRERLKKLQEQLRTIGYGIMTKEEYNSTISNGIFSFKGFDWRYNPENRLFERQELTEEQFRERLRKLLEQLRTIGYGTMSEKDCRIAIETGAFHYGGHVWMYNSAKGYYEISGRSMHEEDHINQNIPSQIAFDQTHYGSTSEDQKNKIPNVTNSYYRPPQPIISKNRGDQPPQHFEDDYVSEEILEQEPGIGYYPIDKKPEIRLAHPRTYNYIEQRRVHSLVHDEYISSTPVPSYSNDDELQRLHAQAINDRNRAYNQKVEYEKVYQRTQTINNKVIGVHPPMNPNYVEESKRRELDDEYLQNDTPHIYTRQTRNSSQLATSNSQDVQVNQNIEDLQQVQTDIFPNTEDLTQQLLEPNSNLEDFGQQQQEPNSNLEDFGQQRQEPNSNLEDFGQQQQIEVNDWQIAQEVEQLKNNNREHNIQQESTNINYNTEEIQAKVVELPKEKEENASLWQRIKNKLFG